MIDGKELKFKVYKQVGAYYSEVFYGYGGTIGGIGCPLIATANALSALGFNMDPGQIWEFMSKPAGAYNVGITANKLGFNAINDSAGNTYTTTMANSIIKWIEDGGSIVYHEEEGHGLFYKSGHWMSMTDVNSQGQVWINDGGYNMMNGWYDLTTVLPNTNQVVFISRPN